MDFTCLDRVVQNLERIMVRRIGKQIPALVPMEDWVTPEKMDDRLDARDFRAAKKQWERGRKKTVSWDKLKLEIYSAQRKAEFLLSNAVNASDYRAALSEVKRLGVKPSNIPHYKPRKRRS